MNRSDGSISLNTLLPLVQTLVDAAHAEAILMDELAQAVARNDKDAVFAVAQKLTTDGESSSAARSGGESA